MDLGLSFYGMDLTVWLAQYGSFALFLLLGMGIFGLPVPEEPLLVLSGFLMHTGDLPIVPSILAAYLGVICGITSSYVLGRIAGYTMIKKYGKWLYAKPQNLDETSGFTLMSKWILCMGYLIPGVRHFTGLFAGSAAMYFGEFAFFAYTGAAFWIILYLSIGYFGGQYWLSNYAIPFQNFEIAMDIFTALLALLFIIYLTYQMKFKNR